MNARLLGWLCWVGVMLALAVPAGAEAGTVWYVSGSGDDANDCLSPATACNNIQLILDKPAFAPGDTIKAADWVYDRGGYIFNEVLLVSEDAVISGGWNADFTKQTGYSDIYAHDLGRVVTVNRGVTVTLQRFFIMEGRTEIGGGAGIHNAGTLVLDHVGVGASERGCGIRNEGTLTMQHSSVGRAYRNSGICNLGTLTMEDSTSDTNTGECAGLINYGTLLMRRSTLKSNVVYDSLGSGGGLCNFGTATVFDSSILNNRLVAKGWPGFEVTGGGIWNSGTLTLVNTTVATNFADHGGGGIYNVGTLTLRNVTLYDNHSNTGAAGLANFGTVSIQNSILAANTNDAGSANCAGAILSDGYNLLDDTTGCPWTATTGDLLNLSPQLLPARATAYGFGINGVQVFYPPAPSSPVIDAGNPAGCTDGAGAPLPTDQRGADRALDGNGDGLARCDMGTNEFDPTEFRYHFLPLVGR